MAICSVSTSWRSSYLEDAAELIDVMKELGVNSLELEFRIRPDVFEEVLKNRRAWGVEVNSLHAVCPAPEGRGRGAEAHLVSDPDEEKRRQGTQDVINTIRRASEIGASCVVLHCGAVDAKGGMPRRQKRYDEGRMKADDNMAELHGILLDRMRGQKKPFRALLKSLEEINEAAVKEGVKVGLENRYYCREMPNLEEFSVIFNTFRGGNLHYWHDTGHAHVQEVLFGVSQELMLETFGDRMIGIHLHDVVNGYTDHNEPGCGEIDWDMVKRYIPGNAIRVMELNKRVSPEEGRQGIAFLRDKGIFV